MISWLCSNAQPFLNSCGLALDIMGAWLVAYEVVVQFRGAQYGRSSGFSYNGHVDAEPTEETTEFEHYKKSKYKNMKLGIFFLTVGFLLQIASNWV